MGIPFSLEQSYRMRDGAPNPDLERARSKEDEEEITDDDEGWISEWLASNPGKGRGDAVEAWRFQRKAETNVGGDIN